MINYILYLLGYKVYEQPIILCVNSFHNTDKIMSESIEKFPHDDDEENYNHDFNLYRVLKRCYLNKHIYKLRS
jgi:hypothetical protein